MKRTLLVSLLLVLVLALAGCAGDTTTPTPTVEEPTAEEPAAEEPAAEEPAAEEPAAPGAGDRLILSTTTSTADSGLLDYILPDFEEQTGIDVDVIAVGTGQALQMGEAGDADVVLVHARALEDAFVENGFGTERYDVMYNDYIIIGPSADPAGVGGMDNAAEAFTMIAEAEAAFISRGDDSGTHVKEQAVWQEAGMEPAGAWYQSAGQGMGAVIAIAAEQGGYTLSDRATFVAFQAESPDTDLEILVEGDPILFNPYGVIPVNPETHPGVNYEAAQQFAGWITSVETQELIASFEVNGEQLFTPDSEQWRAENGGS